MSAALPPQTMTKLQLARAARDREARRVLEERYGSDWLMRVHRAAWEIAEVDGPAEAVGDE